jgi:hypothetical protein
MLIHALAPPLPGGTPVVLRRLLSGLPGVRLEVVTDRSVRKLVDAGDRDTLDARYRYVFKWPGWGGRWRWGRYVVAGIDVALALVAGARAARWARRDGVRWVMSVPDEGFSPIAGAVAARLARLPHVVMVFDLWEENAYNEAQRALAHRLEGPILRSAALVVGYCEELAEHFGAKHGIDVAVLRTPIDPGPAPAPPRPRDGRDAELLSAGAIYWMQEDAVKRLLRAARGVPGVRTVAIAPPEQIAITGLEPDAVEAPVPAERFRERLERADVLFIGLSFHSAHPELARFSTPARLTDYLAAARPLLVHAPADSHLARYCRREQLAEVVDVPDEAALAAALRRILDDPEAACARARRARKHLERVHAAPVVRARFAALLSELAR